MMSLEELRSRTNIHDYLDQIGAEPPPIDPEELKKAKAKMIFVDSIEKVIEALES